MADTDYSLKMKLKNGGEVKGEYKGKNHDGEIGILNWSIGETNSGSASSLSGPGAGRVTMQDMNFNSQMSKASAKLFLACANGDPVTEAVLTCRRAGGQQGDYLTITLTDGLVSVYQTHGSGGDIIPSESFNLAFAKIKIEYKMQKADGSLEPAGEATFDLRTVSSD